MNNYFYFFICTILKILLIKCYNKNEILLKRLVIFCYKTYTIKICFLSKNANKEIKLYVYIFINYMDMPLFLTAALSKGLGSGSSVITSTFTHSLFLLEDRIASITA